MHWILKKPGGGYSHAFMNACIAVWVNWIRLAALQRYNQGAFRLSAVGSFLRKEINAPASSREAEKLNAALEPARRLLNSNELSAVETEGKSMSLEEAILDALS